MVLVINDMVAFSSPVKYRSAHWMLFMCNVGRVSRGTAFSASGGRGGRLGRRLTELEVSTRLSM